MVQRKVYKQFSGKVIRDIDSVVHAGEIYIGMRFRDGTGLTFSIQPAAPILEADIERTRQPEPRRGLNAHLRKMERLKE